MYLQYQLKDKRLLSEDFTYRYADFKTLSLKERAQIINHAVTHMRPQHVDPGELKKTQDTMRGFTRDYETPSDYETTSFCEPPGRRSPPLRGENFMDMPVRGGRGSTACERWSVCAR